MTAAEQTAIIELARAMMGVSNQQLAYILGVHLTTISRWKNGSKPMPRATAVLLRIALSADRPADSIIGDFIRHPPGGDKKHPIYRSIK